MPGQVEDRANLFPSANKIFTLVFLTPFVISVHLFLIPKDNNPIL